MGKSRLVRRLQYFLADDEMAPVTPDSINSRLDYVRCIRCGTVLRTPQKHQLVQNLSDSKRMGEWGGQEKLWAAVSVKSTEILEF